MIFTSYWSAEWIAMIILFIIWLWIGFNFLKEDIVEGKHGSKDIDKNTKGSGKKN
jgi:hypothetical protein